MSRFQQATASLAATGALCVLLGAWFYAGHSFDPADEGFYLNWLATPELFKTSVTEFGLVYHPLYDLVGGDIVALRRINLLLTMGLGVWCATATLFAVTGARPWLLALCLGAPAMRVFDLWLLTPNYNTLTLQAALVVTIGVLAVWGGAGSTDDEEPWRRRAPATRGALVLGVGLALLFLAKPTSAAVVAILVAAVLALGRRLDLRTLLVASTTLAMTLGLATLVIDGSLVEFVGRLRGGAEEVRILSAGHTLRDVVRIDALRASAAHRVIALVVAVSVGSFLWLAVARPVRRWPWVTLGIGSTGLFVLAGLLSPGAVLLTAGRTALFLLAVPAAALSVRYLATRACDSVLPPSRDGLVLAAGLILLPLACVFGSNTNYWAGACDYAIFWLLAAVVLLGQLSGDRQSGALVLLACVAVVSASLAVAGGMARPYRQSVAVWEMHSEAPLAGSTVTVNPGGQQLLMDLRAMASDGDMPAGVPMIDLTGQSPGLIHALEATAVGSPWLIGGQPGSAALFVHILNDVPCRLLAEAWVLSQPDGPRALDDSLLASTGITPEALTIVGRADYPEYRRGPEPPVVLRRPDRTLSESVQACETARGPS